MAQNRDVERVLAEIRDALQALNHTLETVEIHRMDEVIEELQTIRALLEAGQDAS